MQGSAINRPLAAILFSLVACAVATCPDQCKSTRKAAKDCLPFPEPECVLVDCTVGSKQGKRCAPVGDTPVSCPDTCSTLNNANRICKPVAHKCAVQSCPPDTHPGQFQCAPVSDKPTAIVSLTPTPSPGTEPKLCRACQRNKYIGQSMCECLDNPCDACPEGSVCRKASAAVARTLTLREHGASRQVLPGDMFCASCECGYCDKKGTSCCVEEEGKCVPNGDAKGKQCQFGDFGGSVKGPASKNVCSSGEVVDGSVARDLIDVCGCIPSNEARCIITRDTSRTNCLVPPRSLQLPGVVVFDRATPNPDAKLLTCTSNAVFLQTSDPVSLEPDSVIISLEMIPGICAECSPIARTVVSTQPAGNFRGVNCERSKFCLIVSTKHALVPEVIDISLFAKIRRFPRAKRKKFSKTPFEELFGCNAASGTDPEPSMIDGILEVSSPLGNTPNPCVNWLKKDDEGQCLYTNCNVGKRGNTVDCFSCKSDCSDGCNFAPDLVSGRFDFITPCCSHDHCYRSIFSRVQCDNSFFGDMLNTCTADPLGTLYSLPLPILDSDIDELPCPVAALTYYVGVRILGEGPYGAAQEAQKLYEMTGECTKRTTTRAGTTFWLSDYFSGHLY